MKYMFLDESGDLGSKGSKYFVVAALAVGNQIKLDRVIQNMRRNKFKKELKKSQEIKFNSTSDALKTHMIKKLNDLPNTNSYCVVFKKEDYLRDYRYYKKNKHQIYDCIAGNLANQISLNEDTIIRIDKSKGKPFLREQFDSYFKKKLDTNNRKIEIFHSESHAWSGLQFADLIAGIYFQKFERENNQFADLLDINSNLQILNKY